MWQHLEERNKRRSEGRRKLRKKRREKKSQESAAESETREKWHKGNKLVEKSSPAFDCLFQSVRHEMIICIGFLNILLWSINVNGNPLTHHANTSEPNHVPSVHCTYVSRRLHQRHSTRRACFRAAEIRRSYWKTEAQLPPEHNDDAHSKHESDEHDAVNLQRPERHPSKRRLLRSRRSRQQKVLRAEGTQTESRRSRRDGAWNSTADSTRCQKFESSQQKLSTAIAIVVAGPSPTRDADGFLWRPAVTNAIRVLNSSPSCGLLQDRRRVGGEELHSADELHASEPSDADRDGLATGGLGHPRAGAVVSVDADDGGIRDFRAVQNA